MLNTLPQMPTGMSDRFGGTYLKPAEHHEHQSWHCPEMFPLFPYELYGVGLGDTALAQKLNARKTDNVPYRFPAFWPHDID